MPGPMVTFSSSRKLSSYLVRAKLYPLERVTGSCKCHGKRSAMCLNLNETSTFTSSVTHETCKINHKFDCNSKCLIYPLTSKQCSQQYVGQTIDNFRFRQNNYKDNRKYQRMKRVCRNMGGYAGCDEKLAFFLNLLLLLFIPIYTIVKYRFYGETSALISYANRCTGFYLEVGNCQIIIRYSIRGF